MLRISKGSTVCFLYALKAPQSKRQYPRRLYFLDSINIECININEEAVKFCGIDMIDDQVQHVVSDESDKIKEESLEIPGFIDVKEKHDEIEERLRKVLTDNPNYEDFANKLSELVESHPFFNNKDKKDEGDEKSASSESSR